MGRKISAVLIGYLSIAVTVFISFTVLYSVLGTEGAFVPHSYKVSISWVLYSILINLIAASLGGFICRLISNSRNIALILAMIVFILGLAMAIPNLITTSEYAHQPREGEVSNFDAMQRAQQPPAILLLNPIVGALGVYFGSRIKSEKKA